MPNMFVRIPKGAFAGPYRELLVRKLNEAAFAAEQIPDHPAQRALCWLLIDEVDPGGWFCGGIDMSRQLLTCLAMVYLPAGVLDGGARAAYLRLMHQAFEEALPAGETRKLATSVMLHEVEEGTWGANGMNWRLPDFARACGFRHLQGLMPAA